jgi:enoyl-CoA hydratase
MTYETLLHEQHGAVTLLRLNRPQALNALNTQVLADLISAFAAYDADPTQRCLVLTGSEKAFAAGADIKEMQDKGFAPASKGSPAPANPGSPRLPVSPWAAAANWQ